MTTNFFIFIFLPFVIFLIVGLITSPFESFAWWLSRNPEEKKKVKNIPLIGIDHVIKRKKKTKKIRIKQKIKKQKTFIVYISGIGIGKRKDFTDNESNFLIYFRKRLNKLNIQNTVEIGSRIVRSNINNKIIKNTKAPRQSNTRKPNRFILIDHFYPYSPVNEDLTGKRFFSFIWKRLIENRKNLVKLRYILFIVNIRNLFQVMVSADKRYGPIYNFATAERIARVLKKNGCRDGDNICLIGVSGGAQVAVSSTVYLKNFLDCPISAITVGGILASDISVKQIERLYFIYGTRDLVEKCGLLFTPGRWLFAFNSFWNQAKRQGKIIFIRLERFKHNGKGSYNDDSYKEKNKKISNMKIVTEEIIKILNQGSYL